MFTSHDIILGRQTVEVATSKYVTLVSCFSLRNFGFVFSGDIFSSHLKSNSIFLPSKITKTILITEIVFIKLFVLPIYELLFFLSLCINFTLLLDASYNN